MVEVIVLVKNSAGSQGPGNVPVKAFIIDIDGVLKRGNSPIGGCDKAISYLREAGVKFVLATNNSTKRPSDVARDLGNMGIRVNAGEVFTSSAALIEHLATHPRLGKRVLRGAYVVGEEGVVGELRDHGYPVVHTVTDGAVIVGLDTRFTYKKISVAMSSIRAGAAYIATNTDKTYPSGDTELPGAGSMISAISACTGKRPLVMGKPSRNYFVAALSRLGHGAARENIVVVGDRPETDIKMANLNGCRSALVLTGVTKDYSPDRARPEQKPTYVFPNLYETVKALCA